MRLLLIPVVVTLVFISQSLLAVNVLQNECTDASWTDCSHLEGQFPPNGWNIQSDGISLTISEVQTGTHIYTSERKTTACLITRIPGQGSDKFVGSAPGYCIYITEAAISENTTKNEVSTNDQQRNQCGSIIGVDSLSLGEQIPIPGTGEVIAYSSDRTPGFGPNYRLTLKKLFLGNDPASIGSAQIRIQGRLFTYDYSTVSEDTIDFEWDGRDFDGNPITSAVAVIEYHQSGTPPSTGGRVSRVSFGSNIPGRSFSNYMGIDTEPAYRTVVPLGAMNPRFLGLGAWTFGSVHFYDKVKKQIYFGNGSFRNAEPIEKIMLASGLISSDSNADGTKVYVVAHSSLDEAYVFDQSSGLHLGTYSSLTGERTQTINYTSENKILSIVDAFGKTTQFSYPQTNQVIITAPFGQQTTLELNADGQLAKVATAGGKIYNMTYQDATGDLLTSFEKPSGSVASFNYDSNGLLQSDANTSGSLWDILNNYNIENQSRNVTMTTAEGLSYSYDMSYDPANRRSTRSEVLPSGATRQIFRDYNGSTSISLEDGSYYNSVAGIDPRFQYQKEFASSTTVQTASALNQMSIVESRTTTVEPFEFLNVASENNTLTLNNQDYVETFDGVTNTSILSTPEGRQSREVINSLGQTIQTKAGTYLPVDYGYYTNGLLSTISQGTRSTQYFYNPEGYINEIRNPLNQSTFFSYYPDGELEKQTYHDGREVSFGYDSAGRLSSITPPGRPAHGFIENLFDKVSQYVAPVVPLTSDTTTYFEYDNDGRLYEMREPGGLTINYYYDLVSGLMNEMATPEGSHFYTYTAAEQLDTITAPNGVAVDYDYDSQLITSRTQISPNMVATITNTHNEYLLESQNINIQDSLNSLVLDSTVTYGFDNDRLLSAAGDMVISRDPLTGQITGTTLDDISEVFSYDPQYGEIASYEAYFQSTLLYSETYTRDDLGRIYLKQVSQNGITKVIEYFYDNVGRIFEVYVDGAFFHRYIYDANSNREGFVRLNANGVEKTVASTFDDQDRILTFGNKTYSYENNGDRNQKAVESKDREFSSDYDSQGALLKYVKTRPVEDPDTGITSIQTDTFDYFNDSMGQRVEVYKNGAAHRRYVYNSNNQLIAEVRKNGTLLHYVYGTQSHSPDYVIKNGTKFKLIKDQLGSIRLVVNTLNGTIKANVEYDEFGRIDRDTKLRPNFVAFGFAGGLRTPSSGLVRFGARDYDPQIGRWTAKDPIGFAGGDSNIYNYVGLDPTNFIDPSGLARCRYSISTGSLSCTSNLGGKELRAQMYSGEASMRNNADYTSQRGGPIPQGEYEISKIPGGNTHDWFLDPGAISRIGYKLNLGRGGFLLHLRKGGSEGCITSSGSESNSNLDSINNLLNSEAGSNTLEVFQ